MKAIVLLIFALMACAHLQGADAIISRDTGYTLTKVRSAQANNSSYIAASSYEGSVLGIRMDGTVAWVKHLSGIMNNEISCADLDQDGDDEILLANSDGSIYCLNSQGQQLWQFQPNEVPMISVCAVRSKDGQVYVAAGGNDLNFYWLSSQGKLLKEVPSSTYKTPVEPNKKWIEDGTLQHNVHVVNFLRAIPQTDGSDILLLNGTLTNADQNSVLFYFDPLAVKPHKTDKLGYGFGPLADLRLGGNELLIGTSGMQKTTNFIRLNPENRKSQKLNIPEISGKLGFGYRVVQGIEIPGQEAYRYLVKVGSKILLVPDSFNMKQAEILSSKYSFNDICRDPLTGKIVLASSQSGGSCVHVIDLNNKDWKQAYEQLNPSGKIQTILDNTAKLHEQLKTFKRPAWERKPLTVYMMSPPNKGSDLIDELSKNYESPKFLGYYFSKSAEDWDRSGLGNEAFEQARDNRKEYNLSQQQVVDQMVSSYNENGLCAWGGHGVDPFFYQPETLMKVMAAGQGRKSVFIWPELTILYKKEFPFAVEHLFTPFAENARKFNSTLFIRSKHTFWQANIYSPEWSRFLSGEFADVAIPSMEETQDQSMDLSLAGRLGVWAGGVFDDWGTRCARDNPSFTRNRQFSHQELPNHFLRNAVFHTSYGARYVNNFNVDSAYSDYMSVLWELIAKGALYVPKRDEIVSFNPVHLSMTTPDDRYLREGNTTTTSIRYDKDFHPSNPYVFGRLDGAWSGAAVTEWDFSSYAAGVKDRRQNFLAPYSNGMVLITPPQTGVFADTAAPRGALRDNLHPIYSDTLKEHITDGRHYYSMDGKQTLAADAYYKVVHSDIINGAKQIPITVSGDVAWVAAQTDEKHIRLTLIDNGYLNPNDRVASVQFNTVSPVKLTDVLSQETLDVNTSGPTEIHIPCGLFRFIDVEIAEAI